VSGEETHLWEEALTELAERRRVSRGMGGEARLAKHRGQGKLDARARVNYLLDPGSFLELGTLVGGEDAPADAIVMGSGRVDGRPVMVAAEDFTVKAGTISSAANAKRYRVADLALLDRVPLIMMLEGAGFRAEGADERAKRVVGDQLAADGAVDELLEVVEGAAELGDAAEGNDDHFGVRERDRVRRMAVVAEPVGPHQVAAQREAEHELVAGLVGHEGLEEPLRHDVERLERLALRGEPLAGLQAPVQERRVDLPGAGDFRQPQQAARL
jgi:hypothetical protein